MSMEKQTLTRAPSLPLPLSLPLAPSLSGFVKQLIAEEEKLTGRHASVRWDNARQQLILD